MLQFPPPDARQHEHSSSIPFNKGNIATLTIFNKTETHAGRIKTMLSLLALSPKKNFQFYYLFFLLLQLIKWACIFAQKPRT